MTGRPERFADIREQTTAVRGLCLVQLWPRRMQYELSVRTVGALSPKHTAGFWLMLWSV